MGNLKDFNKDLKKDLDEASSFVVRDNVINGKLDTVNETDSKSGITSFKKVQGGAKNNNIPRASIYKQVLTKEHK